MFVTSIDWEEQDQTVLYAQNVGPLELAEALTVDWNNSMYRPLFPSGVSQSVNIDWHVPTIVGPEAPGISRFFAAPILLGNLGIGTARGASQKKMVQEECKLEAVQLIADLLHELLEVEQEKAVVQARA